MVLIDDISAYYYLQRDGVPIYSDGEPAYLESIYDGQSDSSPSQLPESQLFDFGPDPVHLLVTDSNKRSDQRHYRYRVRTSELPPKSFIRLTEDVCVASPELCFVELGQKIPRLRQIELGSEMESPYYLTLDENENLVKRHRPLTTPDKLLSYVQSCTGMRGAVQARTAAKYVYSKAESPMETRVAMSISLPFKYGGLRLPRPLLNHEIPLPEELWDLAGRRNFRLDCYWPGHDFELEYLGKHSHPGTIRKMEEDSIRDTIINYLGYDSLEITDRQAKKRNTLSLVAATIEKKLGTRHINPPESFNSRQQELFNELYNPITRQNRMHDLWE